jgi:hypothetical protein
MLNIFNISDILVYMDSIKDIVNQFKRTSPENTSSETLFDMNTIETNPKKVFGNKHKYISKEYQMYGLRLAGKLDDMKRATMYIKWAKEKPRAILDNAYSFTIDYPNAKDKSKIFIWKVKELEDERNKKK